MGSLGQGGHSLRNGMEWSVTKVFTYSSAAVWGGGGAQDKLRNFTVCIAFYFYKLHLRNRKRERGRNIHFVNILFKTNSEMNVSRLWL